MAPSRLKAKVIREAEVMHDVAQKNCADAEMNSTRVAQFSPRDSTKIGATPQTRQGVVGLSVGVVRDREHDASSRM